MAKTGVDLISTADIARLAGQSRAAVGNWKARNPRTSRPNAAEARGDRSTTVPRSPSGWNPRAGSTSNLKRSRPCGTLPNS